MTVLWWSSIDFLVSWRHTLGRRSQWPRFLWSRPIGWARCAGNRWSIISNGFLAFLIYQVTKFWTKKIFDYMSEAAILKKVNNRSFFFHRWKHSTNRQFFSANWISGLTISCFLYSRFCFVFKHRVFGLSEVAKCCRKRSISRFRWCLRNQWIPLRFHEKNGPNDTISCSVNRRWCHR